MQKNNLINNPGFEKFTPTISGISRTTYQNPNITASITNFNTTYPDSVFSSNVFLTKFNQFKQDVNKIACYLLTIDQSLSLDKKTVLQNICQGLVSDKFYFMLLSKLANKKGLIPNQISGSDFLLDNLGTIDYQLSYSNDINNIDIDSIPSFIEFVQVSGLSTDTNCSQYYSENGGYCVNDLSTNSGCIQVGLDNTNKNGWFNITDQQNCAYKPLCSTIANKCFQTL
jgi:hypothetical protein